MRAFLYVITNVANGKQYVGIAADPKRRWRDHRKLAGKAMDGKPYLHKAMAKEGVAAFSFEVLACSPTWDDGLAAERVMIAQLGTFVSCGGYNLTQGGEGKPGAIFTPETRAKIGAATSTRKHSAETRARIGAGQVGRKHSKESREKRRQAMMGRILEAPSMEQREKLRIANAGKVRSPETRARMSASAKLRWAKKAEAHA